MPLEFEAPSIAAWISDLNRGSAHFAATTLVNIALKDPMFGRTALVSSFGAEAVVLLHMVSVVKPDLPVLFVDTEMLFPETLAYQVALSDQLGLKNVRVIRGQSDTLDADGTLHKRDPDACCDLRKVAPLRKALNGFDTWITGRKRFQGGARAELEAFEMDGPRVKVNPLVRWRPQDILDYRDNNGLPAHPLVSQGYPSIGCMPCTSPVAEGEAPRAGRWHGSAKQECGIHFENGQVQRSGEKQ